MVKKEKLFRLRRQQKDDITIKRLRSSYKNFKKNEETNALNSLDNLQILTFFSILFPTILQFSNKIRFFYITILILMLCMVFRSTFKGIAENSIKHRILAWVNFLVYILLLFNTIISEYFPTGKIYTTLTEDKIIFTNAYNYYPLFLHFSFVLIWGYLSSIFLTYIIGLYKQRAPTLSKQTIDSMISNPNVVINSILMFNNKKVLLLGLSLAITSVVLFLNNMLNL